MDVPLSQVRTAKYWCRRHDCELVPHLMSSPPRTADEVFEYLHQRHIDLEGGSAGAEALMQVLQMTGHTQCRVDPDSWKMPDIMLGEGNFTCPAAEAEFAFDEAEYSTDVTEDLGKRLEEDWPHWVMVV